MIKGRAGALTLLLLAHAPASATTRTVPGEFPLLQDALNASLAGDTVAVSPGTYAGSFTLPAGVTLRGSGTTATSLDGGSSAGVLVCGPGAASPPSRLEDIRLTAGRASFGALVRAPAGSTLEAARVSLESGEATVGGGGVCAETGSHVHLVDTEISLCHAPQGAGALALGGTLLLDRVQIHDNHADDLGGGVLVAGGGQLGWLDGACHDNHSLSNGAGFAVSGGQATLGTVTIADNAAGGSGGGVFTGSSSLVVLSYVDVIGNQAGTGGGGLASGCSALAGTNGVSAACSTIELNHCDVLRNQAPQGAAGLADGESAISASACIIADHYSGLWCTSPLAQLQVQCSLVYGNIQDLGGSCGPTPGSGWVVDDPRICDLNGRDLRLCANSPALFAGCGEPYFGSHPMGCAECAPSKARASSWGAVKLRYRE